MLCWESVQTTEDLVPEIQSIFIYKLYYNKLLVQNHTSVYSSEQVRYDEPFLPFQSSTQGTRFLLGVFAAALVSWADHTMPLLIGIRAQWFPWQTSAPKLDLAHDLYANTSSTEESVRQCLLAMPYSLKHLLVKEPWKSQSQKV